MPEFFSSEGFMPHGHCYLWQPALVWLHLVSDVLIAVAYTTIPFTLVYFIRKRKDVPFRGIFLWFGLFIVSCGATHAFEAWNLYHANYWPSGLAKAFTALASLATACLLVRAVPEALRLPSPAELRLASEGLRESEARYRALFETALDAILVIDDAGRYLNVNPAAATLLGYTREELLSLGGSDVTAPEHQERLRQNMRLFKETGSYVGEYQLLCKDGSTRDADFRAVANVLPGVHVAIARDVTQRKRLEAERQALLLRFVDLQEEERRSISRELHDEVGQLLTGLGLMLDNSEPAGVADGREEMKGVVKEVIGRVRDLSMDLRPPMLDELGVLPTLLWHVGRFEKRTRIAVEFRHANLDHRFPPHVELTAVRVIQEALTNVAKHAGVTAVRVEAWANAQLLGARVEDHGGGFDVAALGRSTSGLSGMRERCRLLHGQLQIDSTPGVGTRLLVELPLDERRWSDQ